MATKLPVYNVKKVSSSMIKTYKACQKKWYFKVFSGIPYETSAAAKLGSEVHLILQQYLDGDALKKEDFSEAAWNLSEWTILKGNLPAVGACHTETKFRTKDGVQGEIDVIITPDEREKGKTNALIMDHKTTSSIERYGLSQEKLSTDIQAMIYAKHVLEMLPEATEVDLCWHYMQTTSLKQELIEITVDREHVEMMFNTIVRPFIEPMEKYLNAKVAPKEDDFEGSTSECKSYGGCEYLDHCNSALFTDSMSFDDVLDKKTVVQTLPKVLLVVREKPSLQKGDIPFIVFRDYVELIKKSFKKPTNKQVINMIGERDWKGVLAVSIKTYEKYPKLERYADVVLKG